MWIENNNSNYSCKAKSYKQYVYKVINNKNVQRKHFITRLLSVN